MISAIYFAILMESIDFSSVFCGAIRRWIVVICIFLSFFLHWFAAFFLEFGDLHQELSKRIALVDIVLTPSIPAPEPVLAPFLPSRATRFDKTRPVTTKPYIHSVKTTTTPTPSPQAKSSSDMSASSSSSQPRTEVPSTVKATTSTQVPALSVTNATPSILANESGQDSLKHGSEARFMHGVATEEFVEDNYIGEYTLGSSGRVWIEDDRKRSGHLILHAEHMNFSRPLFRFNRFIYVYGENADSPSPILGSVTFFSDGYHIHQFLWQHNSIKAYFPRRK